MIQQNTLLDKIEALLNEKTKLSSADKKGIDIGIEYLEQGKGIPHKQVMENAKLKFPNLFK